MINRYSEILEHQSKANESPVDQRRVVEQIYQIKLIRTGQSLTKPVENGVVQRGQRIKGQGRVLEPIRQINLSRMEQYLMVNMSSGSEDVQKVQRIRV